MNQTPLQSVTADDIERYRQDGVVCLRGMFDSDWVNLLLRACRECIADPDNNGYRGLARSTGFTSLKWPSRFNDDIRRFFYESPIAELIAAVIGATEMRFFNDQIFAKDAGVEQKTFWHHDAAGWPVSGDMVPSCWMPLTGVTREGSGLVVARGSHKNPNLFWPITDQSKSMLQPPDRVPCPDFDAQDDVEVLSWEMEPGDVLLMHPRAAHAAGGNATNDRHRVAITSRWFGDDIRWQPRPECVEIPFFEQSRMTPGERPLEPEFPLIWQAAAN